MLAIVFLSIFQKIGTSSFDNFRWPKNVTFVSQPTRVKSGNLGHQVNSDIPLQTVEIQMRRLLMSRLIRMFTVCIVYLFSYSNN